MGGAFLSRICDFIFIAFRYIDILKFFFPLFFHLILTFFFSFFSLCFTYFSTHFISYFSLETVYSYLPCLYSI